MYGIGGRRGHGDRRCRCNEQRMIRRAQYKHALAAVTWLILVLAVGLLVGALPIHAQDGGVIQELTGYLDLGGEAFYRLPSLRAGDTLYVHVSRTSGNLDPWVALADARLEAESLSEALSAQVTQVIAEGQDPLGALPRIYDEFFVAWNDDFGGSYDAGMQFRVPEDGAYQLLVSNAPTASTFGGFRLLLGRNAPQVLSGDAEPTGGLIAVLDADASRMRVAVQEITGTLTLENFSKVLTLERLRADDVFYAYAEPTSGGLAPLLILQDFGSKPLRSDNLTAQEPVAKLSYRVLHDANNYQLQLVALPSGGMTTTLDYRLLLGINEPAVAGGEAEPTGLPVIKEPTAVQIGVTLQQITNVEQVSERFGAVATLEMAWQDPALAFSPDTCECDFRTFSGEAFSRFVAENEISWPEFTLTNQQGNRWTQNRDVVVWPDGRARYIERFTTDFQAPLFDFTRFPFDRQQLYIEVNSLYPQDLVTYNDPEDLSGIGTQLGEEEWYVIESGTEVGSRDSKASFTLRFQVKRYLNFYIFRIIVPILLIVIVSWITFFLKDYAKRVDVASANLLVFVAFNFTVSGDLPRLGYLTFMDAVLVGVFVISAVVVAFNVLLRRLEARGRRELAERIDRPLIWLYPLLYAVGAAIAVRLFLL
jgi:hypothetical protein